MTSEEARQAFQDIASTQLNCGLIDAIAEEFWKTKRLVTYAEHTGASCMKLARMLVDAEDKIRMLEIQASISDASHEQLVDTVQTISQDFTDLLYASQPMRAAVVGFSVGVDKDGKRWCACCDVGQEWPNHKPDCKVSAILSRYDSVVDPDGERELLEASLVAYRCNPEEGK